MKQELLRIGESGATRQTITKQQVEKLLVPVPPVSLQEKFESLVNSHVKHTKNIEGWLMCSSDLFNSLQSRAFSGTL